MRVNPVLRKELVTTVRTPKIIASLIIYNAVIMLITLLVYYSNFGEVDRYSYNMYQSGIYIFTAISVLEMALITFSVPSQTASTISGEREKQTLDILLSTTMKPFQIVIGKLMSSMALTLLLFFSSIPVMAIVFSVGGIQVSAIWQLVIMAFTTAIYFGSIGLYFSCKTRKTSTATVLSMAIVILILIGTFVFIGAVELLRVLFFNATGEIGLWLLVLLINPIMTGMDMMSYQYGASSGMGSMFGYSGLPEFISEYWFAISIIVQLLLAVFFIWRATKSLDRIRLKNIKMKK